MLISEKVVHTLIQLLKFFQAEWLALAFLAHFFGFCLFELLGLLMRFGFTLALLELKEASLLSDMLLLLLNHALDFFLFLLQPGLHLYKGLLFAGLASAEFARLVVFLEIIFALAADVGNCDDAGVERLLLFE